MWPGWGYGMGEPVPNTLAKILDKNFGVKMFLLELKNAQSLTCCSLFASNFLHMA